MNGQLNGFHDAFIEEGTFLFTSESVGEGHPGEMAGPGTRRGAGGKRRLGVTEGGVRGDCPCPADSGKSGSRAFLVASAPRVSPPLPFPPPPEHLLPSGRAPRLTEDSRKREGRGPRQFVFCLGRALFLSGSRATAEPLVGAPPRVLTSGLGRAPRIAATTTCLLLVSARRGEP